MKILLTGGSGYIGSHAGVVLSQAGHDVVLLDNFSNSDETVLDGIESILSRPLPFIKADVRDTPLLIRTLQQYSIEAVIHFAGLKAVGESVANPTLYYSNNVQGSISLIEAMQKVGITSLVFSSSATVYGEPQYLPYDEDHPTRPMNPYGKSKLQVEEMLRDLAVSGPKWKIICLRYFNPVGAHDSGLIGENPDGIPNNLMPYVGQVASGVLPHLKIFGNDYLTKDGTGERDYIHVMDLAEGHLAALNFLEKNAGIDVFNLGTGISVSVLELVNAFEKASNRKVSRKFSERRKGDLPIYFSAVKKANLMLNWQAHRSLDQMCKSAWNWQQQKMPKAS